MYQYINHFTNISKQLTTSISLSLVAGFHASSYLFANRKGAHKGKQLSNIIFYV